MEEYTTLSDEQLVELYREGDKHAFDEINLRYKWAVRSEANKFFLQGGNKDDLLQEGTIGLAKAVNAYRKGESSFKNFAYKCIKNNILTAVSSYSKMANAPLNDGVPLDNTEAENMSAADPLTFVIEEESSEEGIQKVRAVLSDFEWSVLNYTLDGYSYTEIAEFMSRDPKSIDNALQRIKNKIKK